MVNIELKFAQGTTDASKRLVAKLFGPSDILSAYREARRIFRTGDLVLAASEQDPIGFRVEPRIEYLKNLQRALGAHAPATLSALGIAHRSAHEEVKLPAASEALWLVISRGQELPVMCVMYVMAFEYEAPAPN